MNASELRPGIYAVRHTDESGTLDFNLSIVESFGMRFAAGFRAGEDPPRKGKHMMLTTPVRQWIERMEMR